ncbi:MAG: hypothetical protein WCU88_11825 [Elusimicrobiota bacterium]|jgi:4-amino-4-deoxy-L-arabinose transferase-like glycosyltransferase
MITRSAAFRAMAPGIILAVLLLAPFCNKAFTIDDTLFLRQAQHLLRDPLHPTAFEMAWTQSDDPQRMSKIMPSGPVTAYLLVPTAAAGGSEPIAHLTQLALLILAISATVSLGLRMGLAPRDAAAAGLLLAATPAALAMAGTNMPDVPAMAFGVLALERLYAWKQQGRRHQAAAAAAALALATLSRSHLFLLAGIGALALVEEPWDHARWRSLPPKAWAPLAAAPLMIAAIAAITRDPASEAAALVVSAKSLVFRQVLGCNLVAFFTHWVLVLPLALPMFCLRAKRIVRSPVLYGGTFLAYSAIMLAPNRGESPQGFIAPIAGLGAAVLWDILHDAWTRGDGPQFVLGSWLLAALPVCAYLHMPSKYLLASAPAAAILVARALAASTAALRRAVLGLTLVLGAGLGVLILRADAAFADLGRRAAAEMIAPRIREGRNVWFAGHWGFQWYAEKAGARCLTALPPHPLRGDLVVSTEHSFGRTIELFSNRKELSDLVDLTPGGRIMDQSLGAGFYSNAWGCLPWAWGSTEIDRFVLWEIQ